MRKQSRSHLDTLFNAVVLLLNLNENKPITYDLIAILNSIHLGLVSILDDDPKDGIALYKALSAWFLEYIRGNRLPRGTMFSIADWHSNHNCPRAFIELLPFLEANVLPKWENDKSYQLMIQAIFAILSGHRVVVTPLEPKLDTITNPGETVGDWMSSISLGLEALGITKTEFMEVYNNKCANLKLRVINTAGPNGQATWTAREDGQAILANKELARAFRNMAIASNLEWLFEQLVFCADAPMQLKERNPTQELTTGRLHAIEEWGGKTRIVAIVDYWTQALLTPLHETIAFFLKRLDQDGTFDQDKIINKVQKWTQDPTTLVYSYDLSAATDRLPITFQTQLLRSLFNNDKMATYWETLMSGRDFITPDGSKVRYAVGQPMGSKSSFPMLGLTHHVIVKIAAKAANVNDFGKYVILGDDITLTNSNVAEQYLSIMKKLGVGVNLSKSVYHVPKASSAGEICKRIFIKGIELTALPVKLIVKTNKTGHLIIDLQNVMSKRGWAGGKENFLKFAAGLVDRKSLQGLVILNVMPSSVTGVHERINVSEIIQLQTLFGERFKVNDANIEAAFTFALVSEQLKRVDSLLRSTEMMAQTIAHMSAPVPSDMWPSFLFDSLSAEDRAIALKNMPRLPWSHPIVSAALAEHKRVMSHLSGLRAGTGDMVKKARLGLLDILRNSLHEMWLGERERSAIVQRSIFNAAMATLKKITTAKVKEGELPKVSFSLLLTYVQRMWSVDWTWDSPVYINSVKSKVNINTTEVQSKINEIFKDTNISDIRL